MLFVLGAEFMYLVAVVGCRRMICACPNGWATVATEPLPVAPADADSKISRIRIKDFQFTSVGDASWAMIYSPVGQ